MAQLALAAGASSEIGFELANTFAEGGYDLIVATDADAVDADTDKLAACGVEVRRLVSVPAGRPR